MVCLTAALCCSCGIFKSLWYHISQMFDVQKKLADLIEEYRGRCLWFMRPDYMPGTPEEVRRVLDLIERYGDRAGYRRAEEIKACL